MTAVVVVPTPPRAPMTDERPRLGVLGRPEVGRHRAARPVAQLEGTLDGAAHRAFGERHRQVVVEAHGHEVAIERDVVDAADADHDAAARHRGPERRGVGDRIGGAAEVDDQQIEVARPFADRKRGIDRPVADIGLAERHAEEIGRHARQCDRVGNECHGADRGLFVADGRRGTLEAGGSGHGDGLSTTRPLLHRHRLRRRQHHRRRRHRFRRRSRRCRRRC